MEKLIQVEGRGLVTRKPDVIQLSFNLKVENENYQKALELYNDSYGKLIQAITEAGPLKDEVKTENLHVGTHYEQEHDGKLYRNVFKGYLITSNLHVELPMDLQLLSRIIEGISNKGTTPEFTITFGVKEEKEALEEALKEAVLDAKAKAEVLAETLGIGLGHVINVNALDRDEVFNPSRIDVPVMAMKSMEMDMTPRDVLMTRKVQVSFLIL